MFGRKRHNLTNEEVKEMEAIKASNAELKKTVNELTFKLDKINDMVTEVIKKDDSEMPTGDYLNPIYYEIGMSVETGLFYYSATVEKDLCREAIKNGVPSSIDDTEYFEII